MSSLRPPSFRPAAIAALAAGAALAFQPLAAAADPAIERVLHTYSQPFTISGCFDCQVSPIVVSDGRLYGTTVGGGRYAWGTLYRFDPATGYRVLYEFGLDGPRQPNGYLVDATDGNLYGVSGFGGKFDGGTVYRITPAGTITVLHDFAPRSYPNSLMQASDGHLYGTTSGGGEHGDGMIFRVSPDGGVEVVHAFRRGADGVAEPLTQLLQASDGWLYGTAGLCGDATGCVYRISLAGELQGVHDFGPRGSGDADGPDGRLIQAGDGALYGTTQGGGDADVGTVYRISPDGHEIVVHSFSGPDGNYPMHGLIQDPAGNLYGVAQGGGKFNSGVAYRISTGGGFHVIYNWRGAPKDGLFPGAMTLAPDGTFYGVTAAGGRFDEGTFFGLRAK